MATNTEKAKQLYLDCNCNPIEFTLMYIEIGDTNMSNAFESIAMCQLINRYAMGRANEQDWLFDNEALFSGVVKPSDRKILNKALYRLRKKGYIQSKIIGSEEYHKVITDKFYDKELYKRKEFA